MKIKNIVKLAVIAGGTIGTAAIIKAKAVSEDKEVKEWLLNKGYGACNKIEKLASSLGDTLTDLGGTTYDGLTNMSYNIERTLDKLKMDDIDEDTTLDKDAEHSDKPFSPMGGMGFGMGMTPDMGFGMGTEHSIKITQEDLDELFGKEDSDETSSDIDKAFEEFTTKLDKMTEKGIEIGKSAKENLIKTAKDISKHLEKSEDTTDLKKSLAIERAKIDKKLKELDILKKEILDIIKDSVDSKD